MAAMMRGRSSAALTTASTEPTSTARCTLWTRSNSVATSASFSARTDARTSASFTVSSARSAPAISAAAVSARRASRSATRLSAEVRRSTSPLNTTAAAGAPPITDANEPSTASTVMSGLSALENTTNAPP